MADMIRKELEEYVNPEKAAFFPKFFRAVPGGYGEGDKFLGITVPNLRKVAKKYAHKLHNAEIEELLQDSYHEVRLLALFIMVYRYEKADEEEKDRIVAMYLRNLDHVDNWDLVDSSAPKILGAHLYTRDRSILYELARRDHLWSQRISIIATLYFIQQGQFDDTLHLAKILRNHSHDLIHKAVGWMLREVGKRDLSLEMEFLDAHYEKMPRTMLRYAIERFEPEIRQEYLKGTRKL